MSSDTGASAFVADLSRRMAAGDDAAWKTFHEHYGAVMFRVLLAATRGDPHLASEALQRAYLRVARHVRICHDEGQWVSWLRVVARSSLSDARRRDHRFWNFLRHPDHGSVNPLKNTEGETDLLAKLDLAMGKLTPDTRDLLEQKYFRGHSVKEISEKTGVTAKAIESRLTRARDQLRTALENQLRSSQP